MSSNIHLNGEICESDKNILRKYLYIAGVIFVVLDRYGNIVSLNQELCDILGWDVSDIRGKNWFDNFVSPKDRVWLKDVFDSLIRGEVTSANKMVENAIIDKYGNEKIILWHNALIDSDEGKIYGTISSGMNITEKVKMQEEQSLVIGILKLLNRSDSKVDLIGEILSYVKKHSGFESVGIRLREGNDYPYYHTLGFTNEFLIEEKSLCPKYESNAEDCLSGLCDDCMCGAVIHGKTKNLKAYCFTPKGTFWCNNLEDILNNRDEWIDTIGDTRSRCYSEGYRSIALIPIEAGDRTLGLLQLADHRRGMFKNGDIKFYENIVESIGIAIHRVSIEEEMRNAQRQIQETNAKLEDFAYKASHDLREPLRTMTSYAEILEDDLAENATDKQRKYIAKVIEGANLMDKFINDLLSYSRVGTNTEREEVDLNEICENVRNNLDSLLQEKNGTVIFEKLPVIQANTVLMTQLFQNLVVNSLKYDEEGRKPIIEIKCEEQNANYLFSVKDNGIGIAEEYWSSVFEMFKRITPNKYKGTGMGLTICKKIVETLGGKIWFESELHKGTTFYFTLSKIRIKE